MNRNFVAHELREIAAAMEREAGDDVPANLKSMDLSEIARVIYQDWKEVHYTAAPYLKAMSTLRSINDSYLHESAHSVVSYFLVNAASWRGAVAKAVKAELKRRLGR